MAEELPGREWTKRDGFHDRSVPERPVAREHWLRDVPRVDAVPELHYRPGRRN